MTNRFFFCALYNYVDETNRASAAVPVCQSHEGVLCLLAVDNWRWSCHILSLRNICELGSLAVKHIFERFIPQTLKGNAAYF